jgi:hypothetical protein
MAMSPVTPLAAVEARAILGDSEIAFLTLIVPAAPSEEK